MKREDCREGMHVRIVACDEPSAIGIRGTLVKGNPEEPFGTFNMQLRVIPQDLHRAHNCNSWFPPQSEEWPNDMWTIYPNEIEPWRPHGFAEWARRFK